MNKQARSITGNKADQEQRQWHPIPGNFLEQVHQVRKQVIKDSKGEAFEDSAEMIRQGREKRTRYLMQVATGNYDEDPYADDEATPKEQR